MSNTGNSELNHEFKATLLFPYLATEVEVPGYPKCFPADAGPNAAKVAPIPEAIVLERGNSCETYRLVTVDTIQLDLNSLEEQIQHIITAALVNEKQRKAVEGLIRQAFLRESHSLWGIQL